MSAPALRVLGAGVPARGPKRRVRVPTIDGVALDDRAPGRVLGELVPEPGKRGRVADPTGEGGRHRDDRRPAATPSTTTPCPHSIVVTGVLRRTSSCLARVSASVWEPPLKRSCCAPFSVEISRSRAPLARAEVAPHPRAERLPVPARGPARLPGRGGRDPPRHPVEAERGLGEVGEPVRRELRDAPGVAADLAVELDQVLALAEGREALDAELAGQRREPVLRRPDPLPARLDDLAGVVRPERLVERPPADPVSSLEHHDPLPRPREIPSGHEPRSPAPTTTTSTPSMPRSCHR